MNRILILHDNRGYVAGSLLSDAGRKINIDLLKKKLEEYGCHVHVMNLHDLTFPSVYKGWYVIYPSSEDYGLFYKGYIEDILLRLELDGAILLPSFIFFRAHHNKVLMELMRNHMSIEYRTLSSAAFYSIDDLKKLTSRGISYPVVLKAAAGSGSAGVALARDEKELLKKAKKMGKITFYGVCYTRINKIRHCLGMARRKLMGIKVVELPEPREKMILQKFVPNLSHDYKVLVFGEKYYILRRKVRDHDFRASGSGKLEFPEILGEIETMVLDFARGAYEQIGTPLLSIDIAYDGERCHMVEFQCLNFGPYTLQFSSAYYQKEETGWIEIHRKSILEEEMANAIIYFLENLESA